LLATKKISIHLPNGANHKINVEEKPTASLNDFREPICEATGAPVEEWANARATGDEASS
jgi:hypothetical protein